MAIEPLTSTPQQAYSEVDFSPLARLGDQMRQQKQAETLAALGSQYGATSQDAPVPTGGRFDNATDLMANKGSNVQSWYDFAAKPVDQGGLGFTHEQAAAKVSNLQAESGRDIAPTGITGDKGTAHYAAQWRLERLANLHSFATAKGLDPRKTETQQAFMRHEYLGNDPKFGNRYGGSSERNAYQMVTSARTPEQAASAINRYYERSADTTGKRERTARYLATKLQPLKITPY
jgi:hypothetical protein